MIDGLCPPHFADVRDAFERNFADHGDVGAAVAVVIDGEVVVDLWGGDADRAGTTWRRDTIVEVRSATKGPAALCAHVLADRGELDLDAPVTRYWPAFGKDMPVRYLLTHQAGLPVIDEPLPPNAALDWELMCGALERQQPIWEPGTKHGYHGTFGWLVGEVVRRISGRSIGTFLREEIAGPLGVDFFIGTPAAEDARTAPLLRRVSPPSGTSGPFDGMSFFGPDSLYSRTAALVLPPIAPANPNSRAFRGAEIPTTNGIGNARALAVMYGEVARGGGRLLSGEMVSRLESEQISGHDEAFRMVTRWALGLQLPAGGTNERRPLHVIGHDGAGGFMAFADTKARLGFAYVMNQLWGGGVGNPDPRAQSLVAATYASLA